MSEKPIHPIMELVVANAILANGPHHAIVLLVQCLVESGALKPDQYERALQDGIAEASGIQDRADVAFLKGLLDTLSGASRKLQ